MLPPHPGSGGDVPQGPPPVAGFGPWAQAPGPGSGGTDPGPPGPGPPSDAPARPQDAAPPAPAASDPAPAPSRREAELELRLHEESMRRQHAEARARAAEILAEAATARSAVLQAWAAEADEREARRAAARDELVRTLRAGLAELGAELDALRLLAGAGEAADAGPLPGAARLGRPAGRPTPVDPSTRMAELARGARELLAGGRIAAADEVIRGLEDAAARLRAQADPPPPD